MSSLIEAIISGCIFSFLEIYMWKKLLRKPICYNKKIIGYIILAVLLEIINYLFVPNILRISVIFTFFVFINYQIFNDNIGKTILSVFVAHSMSILAEIIFVLISTNVLNISIQELIETNIARVAANTCMAFISLGLFHLPFIEWFYTKLVKFVDHIKSMDLITLFLILITTMNILLYITYYKINFIYLLILNTGIVIIYVYLVYRFLDEQSKNVEIQVEYDNLLDKSVEYETIIDESKKDVHETKNELIVLQSLIKTNKKEALQQVKQMIKTYSGIEDNLMGNQNLYRKTLQIPSGGIRGLIYHKLLEMEEMKINYDLRVGTNINSKILSNTDTEDIRQFGKLIGICIDNAISAVKNLSQKEINIEMFLEEGYFCILIANNFIGSLDIDRLGTMGYTTKGTNHGYGLSLAKEILSKNDNLKNETSVYMNIFSQLIKIKM